MKNMTRFESRLSFPGRERGAENIRPPKMRVCPGAQMAFRETPSH